MGEFKEKEEEEVRERDLNLELFIFSSKRNILDSFLCSCLHLMGKVK